MPSSTISGTPPTADATTGTPGGHRLEDRERRALGPARQHEDVGLGEQPLDVAPLAERARPRPRARRPAISASTAGRSGPSPTIRAANVVPRTAASARTSVTGSFGAASRPTVSTRGGLPS